MATRVLLVDDHKLFREGLKALLAAEPSIEVVGEAGDGRTALRLAAQTRPHIVIMDISMQDLNGIEATRQLVSYVDGVQVLALSMHTENHFVTEILTAGASGYLLKHCATEELVDAIRTVRSGSCHLSREVTGPMVSDVVHRQRGGSKAPAYELLTAREREVLQLLAEGCSTREAAERLHLSVKTISTHREHILDKLQVRTTAALIKFAIREGLTTLED